MKQTNLKHKLLVIGLAAVCVGALTFVLLAFSARTYNIYMKESADGYSEVTAEIENPEIVEFVSAKKKNVTWIVTFRALRHGETGVVAVFSHQSEAYENLKDSYHTALYVTRVGTIVEPMDLGFHGFHILCGGLAVFFLFVCVYLYIQYRRRRKTDFFSYNTVLDLGLSLFFGMQAACFLRWICFAESAPTRQRDGCCSSLRSMR